MEFLAIVGVVAGLLALFVSVGNSMITRKWTDDDWPVP